METQAKGWLASRTVWLGVAASVLGVAEVLTTQPLLVERYPQVISIFGLLVIVLRAITTQPLTAQPTTQPTPKGSGEVVG
jgi:hypothetical protein